MTLIGKIADKLSGSSSSDKHADQSTTVAPGHGQSSTFGGQNSALDTTAGTAGSSGSTYGNEGTTGESMLRQNNTGLGTNTSSTGTGSSYGTGSTQYGADGQRKKGLGEKAKEAVGLDPKDGRDPKDIGYNQGTSSSGYNQTGTSSGLGSSSSSSSSYGTDSTQYGADGQRKKGLGEKAKEAVGLDPKDGRDPKDIGYNQGSSTSSGYSQTGTSSGIDRHMGDLSISGGGKTVVKNSAPIVAERVHDQYENIDKTRVEELHDRTEVMQTVQPVYDERTEATQRSVQDHGLEVHEHGKAGLDSRTEAELAAKREQIARDHRSTHDERTTERSLRPDVDVQTRTNTIEEVVPVLERDIYRPHEIEHTKRVVEIHHEAPEIIGTKVAAPISVSEWESKSGTNLRTTGATSGLTGRTRRGSSSSSSSSDEEVEVDGVKTRRKKGLGEKLKEKVGLDPKDGRDPKDVGYQGGNLSGTGQTGTSSGLGSSSTGYNQTGTSSGLGSSTGTTGYNQTGTSYGTDNTQYGADGQRKKGLGEKAKETVGLDPKDGRDPKDIGYNHGSSTTGSSYGQQGVGSSGTGYNQSGTSSSLGSSSTSTGYNQSGTDSTQYGADGQRKKGFGEKIKEAVGLDPKDGRDPKDAGYNQGTTSSGSQGVARDYTGAR